MEKKAWIVLLSYPHPVNVSGLTSSPKALEQIEYNFSQSETEIISSVISSSTDSDSSLEDLPEAMDDRDEWCVCVCVCVREGERYENSC